MVSMVVNKQNMMRCMVGDGQLVGDDGDHDRNPAREAKRQRAYLRDYFNNKRACSGLARSQTINSYFQNCPKQISSFQDYKLFQKQLTAVLFQNTQKSTNKQTHKPKNPQSNKPSPNTLIYIIPNLYKLKQLYFPGKKKKQIPKRV